MKLARMTKKANGRFQTARENWSTKSITGAILLSNTPTTKKKAKWKYANLEYFIRMIENWESDPDISNAGLYQWLNRISLITRDDGSDDNEGKVNLSTIHAAKGLEFPVVFIAGAEKGLIPHEKSIGEDEDEAGSIEEERRLFYVAITRAREKLYITSCKRRSHLQSSTDCEPSPFLQEIPPGLIKYHEKETGPVNDEQAAKFMAQMKAMFDE
jgi:DNA helicase-2/ATP-dependent DNA helicase PcrA